MDGAPLPEFSDAGTDAAVGRPIPAVNGTTLDGQPYAIAPDDGRAKIILFLAHWCSHCQAEVPLVQDWLESGGSTGNVDLYAVATGNDPQLPNHPPQAWLEREGWTVPTILDDDTSAIGRAYGLNAFPYWVFVRADGTVAQRATGELPIAALGQMIGAIGG